MTKERRVTITVPDRWIEEIDRFQTDRAQFVVDAIRHELERLQKEALRLSLEHPHIESEKLSELGFTEWAHSLPEGDAAELMDLDSGTSVRWVPGQGWVESCE